MSGTSPIRNGLSLAQRFAYKAGESSASAAVSSASKRRKVAGSSSDATICTSAAVLAESNGDGTSTVVEDAVAAVIAIPGAPTKSTTLLANVEVKVGDGKGKKRALSPGTNGGDPSSDVARAFSASLSDAEIAGIAGSLSERQLLSLESETMHPSWLKALSKECVYRIDLPYNADRALNRLRSPYFLKLKRFLWSEGVRNSHEASKNIFPPGEYAGLTRLPVLTACKAREIYSWSRHTPLDKVRIVILGQDPYHNDGQAHGLAFSVRDNVKIPPSLKNIYKEVKTDYPDFDAPKHGYVSSRA